MKKSNVILSLLLVAGLLFGILAGSQVSARTIAGDSQKMIRDLAGIVQKYLDDEEYFSFEYDEENEWFEGGFELDNGFGACDVTIYIFDDMISFTAEPESFIVPEDKRDEVAIFISLVNWGSFYSNFIMDYETGCLLASSNHIIEKVKPGHEEVDTLLYSVLWLLEDYGDALLEVVNGADPHEVYQTLYEDVDNAE